jgi:hypothetical protein
MRYFIPAAATIEISVPARSGADTVSTFTIDVELVTEAADVKEALKKAEKHLEKKFLKQISLRLKNYSISSKPIPINKEL